MQTVQRLMQSNTNNPCPPYASKQGRKHINTGTNTGSSAKGSAKPCDNCTQTYMPGRANCPTKDSIFSACKKERSLAIWMLWMTAQAVQHKWVMLTVSSGPTFLGPWSLNCYGDPFTTSNNRATSNKVQRALLPLQEPLGPKGREWGDRWSPWQWGHAVSPFPPAIKSG